MSTYEPGTVALVTFEGKDVRAMFDEDGEWYVPTDAVGRAVLRHHEVTDVRPLVVLDFGRWIPGTPGLIAEWIHALALKDADCPSGSAALMVAQEIAEQTTPPKPPRIPEPGLWGIVSTCLTDEAQRENNKGPLAGTYVHTSTGTWRHVDTGYGVCWNELHDPTLIREGLS